jgi:hypothetical protein
VQNKKFKYFFSVLGILLFSSVSSQKGLKDFSQIRSEINAEFEKMNNNVVAIMGPLSAELLKDTVKSNEFRRLSIRESRTFHEKRMEILKDIGAVVYPDISFKDADDRSWSLSDFPDKKIMLNFNYSFCDDCMNFIDTLIASCDTNCKLIVLLPDNPKQSEEVITKYGSKALIGFTSLQYKSYYSLYSGSPCVFLLSKGRYISYLYDPQLTGESRKVFAEQVNSWP